MIVTVDVATPSANTGPVPVIVDVATAAAPGLNTTTCGPSAIGPVRLTFLDSARVLVNVHVATPEPLLTPQLGAELPVPETVTVGVTPGTGLLRLSRKVMVTVDVATPSATTGEVATIEELATIGALDVKDTLGPLTDTGEVMLRVLLSAVVDAS